MTRTHQLTWRQALVRVAAGIALGAAIAAAVATHDSASAARADPAPTGTAASKLSVLRTAPVDVSAPSAVASGFDGAAADASSVRLLGRNPDVALYATARSGGGACNAIAGAKGTVGTMCVEDIPAEGITLGASDTGGWTLYGFAADDVVGVDVVLEGKAQPASLLQNAYVADLGSASLNDATELVVHHADGTQDVVPNTLRAPGS